MIEAVKAGKDIYVEKPLTNTLWEGRQMIKARQPSGRMVAVDLNRRGNPVCQMLIKDIPTGKIGKITVGKSARINNMFEKQE